MSHYTKMQVKFSQDYEEQLLDALRKVAKSRDLVSIYDKPTRIKGYDQSPPVDISVSRRAYNGSYNDVAFARTSDGGYQAYIDDLDKKAKSFVDNVSQEYTLSVAELKLGQEGWQTHRQKSEDGVVQVVGMKVV